MSDEALRGADRVNDELEVGYDLVFERRFHYAEIAGRAFLFLVVALALSGLLGRGPLSHESVRTPGGGPSADYEPVARYDTPTQVTLHLHPAPGQSTTTVVVDTGFIEPMGLTALQPTPLSSAAHRGGLALTFGVQPTKADTLVRLELKPSVVGPVSMSATVDGAPPLSWTQVILP
ncbi:MAG: hypothetical protein ACRYGC_02145 [Janthinobacterium lividum]